MTVVREGRSVYASGGTKASSQGWVHALMSGDGGVLLAFGGEFAHLTIEEADRFLDALHMIVGIAKGPPAASLTPHQDLAETNGYHVEEVAGSKGERWIAVGPKGLTGEEVPQPTIAAAWADAVARVMGTGQ